MFRIQQLVMMTTLKHQRSVLIGLWKVLWVNLDLSGQLIPQTLHLVAIHSNQADISNRLTLDSQ